MVQCLTHGRAKMPVVLGVRLLHFLTERLERRVNVFAACKHLLSRLNLLGAVLNEQEGISVIGSRFVLNDPGMFSERNRRKAACHRLDELLSDVRRAVRRQTVEEEGEEGMVHQGPEIYQGVKGLDANQVQRPVQKILRKVGVAFRNHFCLHQALLRVQAGDGPDVLV